VRNLDADYRSGTESCLLGVFAMSETPSPINDYVRQALMAWIDSLAGVLLDAGLSRSIARARAEDAVCRIQGALLLTRAIGSPAPFTRTLKALQAELLVLPSGGS